METKTQQQIEKKNEEKNNKIQLKIELANRMEQIIENWKQMHFKTIYVIVF